MSKPSILIVDDHPLFRRGLCMIFEQASLCDTPIEAGSISEAKKIELPVDLILLDIHMPGLDGINGISVLKEKFRSVPIIILSATSSTQKIAEAQERGAIGFLQKTATTEEFVNAINGALKGQCQFPKEAPKGVGIDNEQPHLTPRQLEVLGLLAEGKPNKLIARQLEVSENTVRTHVGSILEQLNVISRTEAVLVAQRLGLVHNV